MNLVYEPTTLAVAETDAVLRDFVVRALRNDFKVIITAARGSGKSAQLLSSAQLVIYDLKLGIHDLKRLRKDYPEMPIVLISSRVSTTALNEALELDRTDFITKPVDSKELRIRVNQCLRRWRFYASRVVKQSRAKETSLPSLTAGPRSSSLIEVPMPELHGPSGRLNAARIAKYLNVPLSEISTALHVNYTALHKTPDSPSVQSSLALFKRTLVILTEMLGEQKAVRSWLNSPHPDLGQRSPISVILDGHADAVLAILENALAGVSS